MTIRNSDIGALAVVAEVADALAPHGRMPCQPTIEEDDDGLWTLSLTFRPGSTADALAVLELAEALQRVRDVAQLRGFAERYQIDARLLERMIDPDTARQPAREEEAHDGPSRTGR